MESRFLEFRKFYLTWPTYDKILFLGNMNVEAVSMIKNTQFQVSVYLISNQGVIAPFLPEQP